MDNNDKKPEWFYSKRFLDFVESKKLTTEDIEDTANYYLNEYFTDEDIDLRKAIMDSWLRLSNNN